MRQVYKHGRKEWNNGWRGRRGWDRAIEKRFRASRLAEIEAEIAASDELVDAGVHDGSGVEDLVAEREMLLTGQYP